MFRLVTLAVLLSAACGGSDTGYAAKCKSACDPSAVMACAAMTAGACEAACEALTKGLTAICATCLTEGNAWSYGLDQRQSGSTGCHGYAFPSTTDTSTSGCGSACQ